MKQGIFFFTIIIAHWSPGLSDLLNGQVKKLFLITLLWKDWVKRKNSRVKLDHKNLQKKQNLLMDAFRVPIAHKIVIYMAQNK